MSEVEITRDTASGVEDDNNIHSRNMELWRQSMDYRQSFDQNSNEDRGSMSSSAMQSRREPKDVMLIVGKPAENESQNNYKGRLRTWPGLLLLFVIVGGAVVGIVLGAKVYRDASAKRISTYMAAERARRAIDSGVTDGSELPIDVDTDGQVGNPKTYTTQQCSMLDYVSKKGRIFAVLPNKTETQIDIKGTNWFGMETGNAIPFGLWTNDKNGTTAYEIATFLAANKFNAVRLPVCVSHILSNIAPRKGLINLQANRAIDVTSYMSTLKSIIKALAYRNIGVMISMHTLTPQSSGGTWYDNSLGITKEKFLSSIDVLTKELCSSEYWNIIGVDLKNEPHLATWADFSAGAEIIGDRMLSGCSNWLAFVEGVNSADRKGMIGGVLSTYGDWWGGGLQDVKTKRVKLSVDNKIVYAPHYYNSGVYPQTYFYGPAKAELSDNDLRQRVSDTATDMFGYIANDKNEALVLGEFAGLYATDAHPLKTTKRTTDFLIEVMLRDGYAGGFMWSLNPESAYQYNPNGPGTWTEGLLLDDWLTSNADFVKGMAALDKLPSLQMLPCVPKA